MDGLVLSICIRMLPVTGSRALVLHAIYSSTSVVLRCVPHSTLEFVLFGKSEFRQWPTPSPSSCLVSQPTKISSDTIYVIVLSITSMLFLFTSTFFDFRCLGIFLALFPFFNLLLFFVLFILLLFFFPNLCFFLVGIKVAYNQVSSVYDLEQLLLFLNQCNEPLSFI